VIEKLLESLTLERICEVGRFEQRLDLIGPVAVGHNGFP
jgi:hypothetical protein